MSLFKGQDLTYFYPEQVVPALNQLNLEIASGEFLLLIGGSGSGKSTLARVLAGLIPEFYGGRFGGQVYFQKQPLREFSRRDLAQKIGMVFQDPEKQLVMTGVEAEIAFGLENLGLPPKVMQGRVAEVMHFMDLTGKKREFTGRLSSGWKQKLALASVLAMHPKVLILDEPTSQLDPVAAEAFFNLIKQLNEEMGLTIVLIEQRLERCFHLADRIIFLEEGQILYQGRPEEYAAWAKARGTPFIPVIGSFFAQLGFPKVPLTIKEGRTFLRTHYNFEELALLSSPVEAVAQVNSPPVTATKVNLPAGLNFDQVWFTYPKGKEALRDINLSVQAGEFVALLGANGAGKTTLLKVAAGALAPSRGKVSGPENTRPVKRQKRSKHLKKSQSGLPGRKIAYLAQNPNAYLFHDTVEEELLFSLKHSALAGQGHIDSVLSKLDLSRYRTTNPRDLSSGERQRVALATLLVTQPQFLLLDEPTRGMDYALKQKMGQYLSDLVSQGIGVLMVTHDVEFAALYASRVVMLFDGEIISDGPGLEGLRRSFFYTTQMDKMCRGLIDGVLTLPVALARFSRLPQKRKAGGEVG